WQTKVRCSTRATSSGLERCRTQPGWVSWLSGSRVPSAIMACCSAAASASLPSHQTMRSGRVSDATSSTHFCSDGRRVPGVAFAPCWGTAFMSRASEVRFFQAGHAILSSAAGAAVLHRIKNGPVAHPPGMPRRSVRDERIHQVLDVFVELLLRHSRLVQLQVELQEADV